MIPTCLPVSMVCDASQYRVGAVISHLMSVGTVRPIAYGSKALTKAEKNYAQIKSILSPKSSLPTLAATRLQKWAIIFISISL